MKSILAFLIIQFFVSNCFSPSERVKLELDLEGTRWEYGFEDSSPEVKDYIEFSTGNKYIFHSAEVEMTYTGVYFFQRDTLNLIEVSPLEGNYKYTPSHDRAIIKDDKLIFVGFEELRNGKWKKKDYLPPDDYYLTKVN